MGSLTKNAKIGLAVIILLAVLGAAWGFKDSPVLQDLFPTQTETGTTRKVVKKKRSTSSSVKVLKGSTVTWMGHSGIYALNNGLQPDDQSTLARDFGITIDMMIDDVNLGREAFKADQIDFLWCTLDALPTEMGDGLNFANEGVKFITAIDKSRGGDAIVANEFIKDATAESIRGKRIIFTPLSPSHTMVIKFLESIGLTMSDIEPVTVSDAVLAAQYFKDGEGDIAAVWSPDDLGCLEAVSGSKILMSTKDMPHIIVDGIIVKEAVLAENYDAFVALVAAWNHGNHLMNTDASYREKTVDILASSFEGFTEDEWRTLLPNAYYPNIEDNLQFMGIEDVAGDAVSASKLYAEMAKTYKTLEDINAINWRSVGKSSVVKDAKMFLQKTYPSVTYVAEGGKSFEATSAETLSNEVVTGTSAVLASKDVQIQFETNSSTLSSEGMRAINTDIAKTLTSFTTSYVVISGHTDGVGGKSNSNRVLSENRAKSVRTYLVTRHNINPNRIVTVGHGYDKPKYSGASDYLNRRVEINLVKGN